MAIIRETEAYLNYLARSARAWDEVEWPVIQYVFQRHFSNRHLVDRPHIKTCYGLLHRQPWLIDLGSGTGRLLRKLTDIGINRSYMTGVEGNANLMKPPIHMQGTHRVHSDLTHLEASVRDYFGFSAPFAPGNLGFRYAVSNMVMHTTTRQEFRDIHTQLAGIMAPGSRYLMIVRHPLHNGVTLDDYGEEYVDTSPWGEQLVLPARTIEGYVHDLYQCGFSPFEVFTTGLAKYVHRRHFPHEMKHASLETRMTHEGLVSNYLTTDEGVFVALMNGARDDLSPALRLVFVATRRRNFTG